MVWVVFLLRNPFFGFGLLFVVIIAFGCGIEIDVAARRHADIALRRYLRGFGGDIAPGEDLGIRPLAISVPCWRTDSLMTVFLPDL